MKPYIGWFYIPRSQVRGKRRVKEYYIAKGSSIVAGDFKGYNEAKAYLPKVR